MSTLLIRNIPENVHTELRRIAAERHVSTEALARSALVELARQARPVGIDFAKLAYDREALGIDGEGPAWTDAADDPALSRRILGLPDA